MAGRRPAAWNQWAEVVGREARKPRFVGDMPHGWVASDFMRSLLDMFAYERESDRSMVIAAGIPATWIEGGGIALEGLRTPWGTLGYSLRRERSRVVLTVHPATRLPPGGLVFPWPLAEPPRCVRLQGREARFEQGEIRIASVPAQLVVDLAQACASFTRQPAPASP